jgi:hypothetical protein
MTTITPTDTDVAHAIIMGRLDAADVPATAAEIAAIWARWTYLATPREQNGAGVVLSRTPGHPTVLAYTSVVPSVDISGPAWRIVEPLVDAPHTRARFVHAYIEDLAAAAGVPMSVPWYAPDGSMPSDAGRTLVAHLRMEDLCGPLRGSPEAVAYDIADMLVRRGDLPDDPMTVTDYARALADMWEADRTPRCEWGHALLRTPLAGPYGPVPRPTCTCPEWDSPDAFDDPRQYSDACEYGTCMIHGMPRP